MFVLIGVKDTIPVAPEAFGVPTAVALQDAINKKYANKLMPNKGLALSCFDILTAEDGKVTWGNGLMYYKVSFRLMLFAPFLGEVIVGKVVSSTKSYIRVSLGFFEDIYIIPSLLAPNSTYDPEAQRFFWWSDPDPEDRIYTHAELMKTVVASRLYIDPGEPIRFRVGDVEWQDVRPNVKSRQVNGLHSTNWHANGQSEMANGHEVTEDPISKAGYKVMASIAEAGLGVVSWWQEAETGEEEVMDES